MPVVNRSARVPSPPATGRPVMIGRRNWVSRTPWAGAAAWASTAPSSCAGTRSVVDRPLPSTSCAPAVSNPAWDSATSVCAARAVERGLGLALDRDLAGEHLGEHVVRRTDRVLDEVRDRRGGDGGEHGGTGAAVASATLPASAPRSPASARPAVNAGSGDPRPVSLRGVLAAAVEHQRLDRGHEPARDVRRVPGRLHGRAAVAAGVDQHPPHGGGRGLPHGVRQRGEPRRVRVDPSFPAGRAVRVGSPPPTRITVPGPGPATTRVTSRSVGFSVSSAADVVRSFAVLPGTRGCRRCGSTGRCRWPGPSPIR